MNVIKVKNLRTPWPSKKELEELRAGLTALAGPDDPLTLSVSVDDWPGRQTAHLVYYAGLRTLTELDKLDESKLGPITWRCFAGGHKNMTSATGCMATYGGPGFPPVKVMAVTRGPAPADVLRSTEMLNELSELSGNPNSQYELRVLRMPALGMEAFWLHSQSANVGDLVVPYGSLPDAFNLPKPSAKGAPQGNQAYSEADFLKATSELAQQRLAKPDITPAVPWTRTRKTPIALARLPSLHLPRPAGLPSPTGIHVAGAPLRGIGAPSKDESHGEPDRVVQAGH
jgi:hypothetical protein